MRKGNTWWVAALLATVTACSGDAGSERATAGLPTLPSVPERTTGTFAPSPSATPSQASPSEPPSSSEHYGFDVTASNYAVPENASSTQPDGAAGSGCQPPERDSLPDGVWRGLVTSFGAGSMDFDLMCSYSFESERYLADSAGADTAAYVTQNSNPSTRTLNVSASAIGWTVATWQVPTTPDAAVAASANGEVWVAINDGEVTELLQVYYP